MDTWDSPSAAQWELGKLVNQLDLRITSHVRERAGRLDLTTAQAAALRELTEAMTMSELAGKMSCEPSNATVVIDGLEKRGLIMRQPHPTDRRSKQVYLTPEGTERRAALLQALSDEPPLPELSDIERLALRDLLHRALSKD